MMAQEMMIKKKKKQDVTRETGIIFNEKSVEWVINYHKIQFTAPHVVLISPLEAVRT